MSKYLHVITEHLIANKGGLEMWTFNHIMNLSRNGFKLNVYVTGPSPAQEAISICESNGVKIYAISSLRNIWEQPLLSSGTSSIMHEKEKHRLNFNIIKNLINSCMRGDSKITHCIISNFLTGSGYLASNIAHYLDIAHIACVVGTDYSRGFYNPQERSIIDFVVSNSSKIVTWNGEQTRQLSRIVDSSKLHLVHTSIDNDILKHKWKQRKGTKYKLFCDSGFSYKKGTQVLLHAFETLKSEDIDVSILICGGVLDKESNYWNKITKEFCMKYPNDFIVHNHLTLEEVRKLMMESDIYCSATLGEGCSLARVAALCCGIPIVTTRCGEMTDIPEANHIYLANPVDDVHYTSKLREMCQNFENVVASISTDVIQHYRDYFVGTREISDWLKILESLK